MKATRAKNTKEKEIKRPNIADRLTFRSILFHLQGTGTITQGMFTFGRAYGIDLEDLREKLRTADKFGKERILLPYKVMGLL